MIVDTSAIIAVLQREDPHAEQVVAALAADRSPTITSPCVVECLIVLSSRHGALARMTYAAAKLANEPLIAVGNDFAKQTSSSTA